jgi:hypothetical protein
MITKTTKYCLWPWEFAPEGAYGFEDHPEWDCETFMLDTLVSEWEL